MSRFQKHHTLTGRPCRTAAGSLFLALLFVSLAHAQAAMEPSFSPEIPGKASQIKAAAISAPGFQMRLSAPPEVSLQRVAGEEVEQLGPVTYNRIGITRKLPKNAMQSGAWETLPDGRRAWRFALRSPGAMGLRIHFEQFDVAEGLVWIYDAADFSQAAGPFFGNGTQETGDFWSDMIFSESVVVEYVPTDPNQPSSEIPFRIGELAHFWELAPDASKVSQNVKKAGKPDSDMPRPFAGSSSKDLAYCHVDPDFALGADWNQRAVAAVVFFIVDKGNGWSACSGTILNSSQRKPYLLTANHCIASQAEAGSLQAFWGYNRLTVSYRSLPTVKGGTYLRGTDFQGADWALVELSGFPAINVLLSGWDPNPVGPNVALVSVGHPEGSYKRVAAGYTVPNQDTLIQGGAVAPANEFLRMAVSWGAIEGGMSGGGVFRDPAHLVAVNSFGPDNYCSGRQFLGAGKFSEIYPQIRQYLVDDQPQFRPAEMSSPAPGSRLPGGTVTFRWSGGVGVEEYHLAVGATAETYDFYSGRQGRNESAAVSGLPTDGRTVYVQLFSGANDRWVKRTYTYSASLRQSPGSGVLRANPQQIRSCNGMGQTSISWQTQDVAQVELRIASHGNKFWTRGGPNGTATTGAWVSDGMTFALLDASSGRVLDTVTISVVQDCRPAVGRIYAESDPIYTCGTALGRTRILWEAPNRAVEIRVNNANGTKFSSGFGSGSALTGDWVRNGMRFYLVDANNAELLASTAVTVADRCR